VRELRVAVDRANMQETTLLEGMYARVTTLPADSPTTAQGLRRFKAPPAVARSKHLLTGPLRVSPVDLKTPSRIEGVLFLLWLALVA
jgi:hypothetical protein